MSFKTITLSSALLATIDMSRVTPTLQPGQNVAFDFTGVENGSTVNVWICNSTLKARLVSPADWQGPIYSVPWTVDVVPGEYTLIFEQRLHGVTVARLSRPIVVQIGVPIVNEDSLPNGNDADGEVVRLVHVPYGFCGSGDDDPAVMKAGLAQVAGDGGGVVRLWHGGFGDVAANVLTCIDAAVAAGLDVILTVNAVDKGSNKKVTKFGKPDIGGFVTRNATTLRKCKYVEAGNELNINQYRPDDFGDSDHWHAAYVAQWLQPLSTALTAIGVQTLCASVTGDSNHPDVYGQQLAKLVAAGASKYCVGYCVHCYWHADKIGVAGTLVPMLVAAQTTCGLPVHITEAGLDGSTPEASFPAAIVMYLQDLRRAAVASISVYRGGPHPIWPASRSLFDRAGRPTAIYPVVIGALKS